MFDTGEIDPWGTRAFVSASNAKNDNPFNNYGKVDKQQYNAQASTSRSARNGDFVSIAGHYNQNRNNFFGSLPLRHDLTAEHATGAVVPRNRRRPLAHNRFPRNDDEREYDINFPCTVDMAAGRRRRCPRFAGPGGTPIPT